MEHIEQKYSLASGLQIKSICSVGILDILEVIRRFSVIEKSSILKKAARDNHIDTRPDYHT